MTVLPLNTLYKQVATRRRNPDMTELASIKLSPIQPAYEKSPFQSPHVTTRRQGKRDAHAAELNLSPTWLLSDPQSSSIMSGTIAKPSADSPAESRTQHITIRRSQRTNPLASPTVNPPGDLSPKRARIAQLESHDQQIQARLQEFTAAVVAITGTSIDISVSRNALEMVKRYGDLHLAITPDTPKSTHQLYKSSLVTLYKWAQKDSDLGSGIRKTIAEIDPSVKAECSKSRVKKLFDALSKTL